MFAIFNDLLKECHVGGDTSLATCLATVADLGFFKGRGHSGATIYRGGPSIMQFFLDYFVTWH